MCSSRGEVQHNFRRDRQQLSKLKGHSHNAQMPTCVGGLQNSDQALVVTP